MYEPRYLVFVSEDNHNKWYSAEVVNGQMLVKYGRIGNDNYQTCTYSLSMWDKKINEKIKKGYVDKTDLRKDLMVFESIKTANGSGTSLLEIANKSISNIIKRLQSFAKKTIEANYKITEKKTTQEMIDEAQILINSLVNVDDIQTFNKILLEIFTTIPRKMAKVGDYLAKCQNDFEKIIQREQDLLDTMAGSIYKKPDPSSENTNISSDNSNNSTHTILDEMGIIMEDVDNTDVDIIKKLLGTESRDRYVNAWRVTNLNSEKKFQNYIKKNNITNTKLLFHGTRSCNVFSILKSSLLLRPTDVVINGKLYGQGIYFAPRARKSIGYTSLSNSYWANGSDKSGFLIVFETAYGTPYDVTDYHNGYSSMNYDKLQTYKKGANCLHAHAGASMGGYSTLKNDEIVFYDESAVHMKYLVEIK